MKTLLLSLAILLTSSLATSAQDVATVLAGGAPHSDTVTSFPLPVEEKTATTTATAVMIAKTATASLNDVTVQIQTLPASSTVLVTFSMPPQDQWGTLELADAATGKVLYVGTVLVNQGQVELPVTGSATAFEARLSTDRDMVIARMNP